MHESVISKRYCHKLNNPLILVNTVSKNFANHRNSEGQ